MTSDIGNLPDEGKRFGNHPLGIIQVLYDVRDKQGVINKFRMCKLVYKHEEAKHVREV